MLKRYRWFFHLFLIAAGAYLVADIVNLMAVSRLEAAVASKSPLVHPSDRLPGRADSRLSGVGVDYRAIIEGNIFNSRLRGGLSQEIGPPSSDQSATPQGPLQYLLIGTVVGEDAPPFSVIEHLKDHSQFLYRVGDFLEEEAQIVQIRRSRVMIKRGQAGEIQELSLPVEGGELDPRVVPLGVVSAPAQSGVRRISNNRWVLDRREVDNAVGNLPQLLTKARVIPNFNEGKPDGFRIFAIHEDSIYSKIGLQNGDILHRVNGIEVRDPQNFLRVFEQLKNENNLIVDLVRNSQKETFSYEIR